MTTASIHARRPFAASAQPVHTPRPGGTLQLVRAVDGWRIRNALWRAP